MVDHSMYHVHPQTVMTAETVPGEHLTCVYFSSWFNESHSGIWPPTPSSSYTYAAALHPASTDTLKKCLIAMQTYHCASLHNKMVYQVTLPAAYCTFHTVPNHVQHLVMTVGKMISGYLFWGIWIEGSGEQIYCVHAIYCETSKNSCNKMQSPRKEWMTR